MESSSSGVLDAGEFLPLADSRGYLASIDRDMLTETTAVPIGRWRLGRLGLGYVQGYGIGRPAPIGLLAGLIVWHR